MVIDREDRSHEHEAWCSQHQCHPHECFATHFPEANDNTRTLTPEEQKAMIANDHLTLQAMYDKQELR